MRRLDLVPVALVVALAGVVGTLTIRSPRPAPPSVAVAEPLDSGPSLDVASEAGGTAGGSVLHRRAADAQLELRRSALAPPDFDREDVLRRLGYGAANTYIMEMIARDSGIARWPDRPAEPIRVWVEPSSSVADWRPEYVDAAREAFEHWQVAGIPVRVNFLVDSVGAEVRVVWIDHLAEDRIGSTRRFRDQHWWLVAGEITLALHTSRGAALAPEIVAATATHEAGHVLGLNHSPNPADLMATRHHGVNEPSPADLATMRLLYTVPPGRLR